MAFEIELKAWVNDRSAVEKRIGELAEFTADFKKDDVYWVPVSRSDTGAAAGGLPLSGVRIRRETTRARGEKSQSIVLVTYKTKEVRDGIEVNDEKEFTVTGLSAFEELLRRIGLEPGIFKKKRGRSWRYGGADAVTVELSDVERLGCFVELEIMADDNDADTVNATRKKLLSFLKLVGISEDRIEPRYYNDMLKAARDKG
ncbi:MAG: class IV adenylate cyclase [Spirochaetaceae bacterium]|jgi:adenylate cyclase class 2|nr:class IV adenylate cyclase [Spirochaetaceae bacterium]